MKLAAQHIPGTDSARLSGLLGLTVDYAPKCPWPDDCTVQWGDGICPATPFFEAFPPGTFIRGEGETIEAAELKAFAQFEREFLCRHIWGRQSRRRGLYLNGAGWCRKCDAFRGKMFCEVVVLGHWRRPLKRWERDWLTMLETDHDMNEHMDRTYPEQQAGRKRSQRVMKCRIALYGVDEESSRIGLFDA